MANHTTRCSELEAQKRLKHTIELIQANTSKREIIEIISKDYKVTESMGEKYYYKAMKRLRDTGDQEIDDRRLSMVTSLEEDVQTTYKTYKEALSKGNHRDAQQWFKLYQDALNNLRSLYPDALTPKSEGSDLEINITYGVVEDEESKDE